MFIAIYLRINQYGFTENRYFIVAIGIWATFAMTFINIDKGKRNTILVVSLAITLLISSYGPLSATSVAIRSQNARFENILERNDMLRNGEVIANSDIPDEEKKEIANIINYFNRHYKLSYLEYLPEDYNNTEDTEEVFGFPHYGWNIEQPVSKYFNFHGSFSPFVLEEYDLMIPFMHYRYGDIYHSEHLPFNGNAYYIQSFDNTVEIFRDQEVLMEIDLLEHAEALIDEHGRNKYDLGSEELTFILENESVKIRLIYTNLSGTLNSESEDDVEINSEGYILLEVK